MLTVTHNAYWNYLMISSNGTRLDNSERVLRISFLAWFIYLDFMVQLIILCKSMSTLRQGKGEKDVVNVRNGFI
jgi:hypothetical protein